MHILSGLTEIVKSSRILGVDESGKGDFLGPLVIAGVLADEKGAERLRSFDVRDSKKISDGRILELSNWIKENFVFSIVVIGPEKYNQLYKKIGNLNKLLAWGHSRIIENVSAENQIDLAVSDNLGDAETYEITLTDFNRISLRVLGNNKIVTVRRDGMPMTPERSDISTWEKFDIETSDFKATS